MSAQDLGAGFIRLGLSIDQHFPGYVDAYFGPDTIAQSVRDEGKVPLTALEALADQLARSVAGDASLGFPRQEYLLGEIAAVRTTIGVLQGVVPGIHDEVRLLYGVTPTGSMKSPLPMRITL
jgi:hypothetical protein